MLCFVWLFTRTCTVLLLEQTEKKHISVLETMTLLSFPAFLCHPADSDPVNDLITVAIE